MRHLYRYVYVTIILCLSVAAHASWQDIYAGRFATAVAAWQAAPPSTARDKAGMVRAYRHLGLYAQAQTVLEYALFDANSDVDEAILLNEQSKLSLARASRNYQHAREQVDAALSAARRSKDSRLLAEVLNQQGNVLAAELNNSAALDAYAAALRAAPPQGDLQAKIRLNQIRTLALEAQQREQDMAPLLRAGFAAAHEWADRYSQIFALLQLIDLAQGITDLAATVEHALQRALSLSESIDNPLARSYAYGYLGRYFFQRKAYDTAIQYNRRALFFADKSHDAFRWYRQLGQTYSAQGQLGAALNAYRHAAQRLKPLRHQVGNTGYRAKGNFRDSVAPVYFELADVALRYAETFGADKQNYQALLKEARQAVEDFKQAEFQDYFQSPCVGKQGDCARVDDLLDANTAALYPVIQDNHIDLLLSTQDGIHHFTVEAQQKALQRAVLFFLQPINTHPAPRELQRGKAALNAQDPQFRQCELNTQRSNASAAPLHPNSLKYAQQLYQWLIAPLDDALRNIETLIVVPDGILLHLPFAALHDGKQFLIEKFAVAVSPGLCLTQARLAVDKNNLLLGGLSEEVQGFSALPCAGYELDKLHESAAGNTRTLLLNQDFTRDSFRKSVENHNFDVVHLASHGEFSPQPDKSFILTYDGRLSLNDLGNLARLGELRGRPLDLLTLSACETAKGNDRAALGLAGVTLQSGAVSALASLWKVDDTATPAVVLEFYRQWQNGASKAQALRQAQLKLLQDEQYAAYRHPYYWSAFLLIGNWL